MQHVREKHVVPFVRKKYFFSEQPSFSVKMMKLALLLLSNFEKK